MWWVLSCEKKSGFWGTVNLAFEVARIGIVASLKEMSIFKHWEGAVGSLVGVLRYLRVILHSSKFINRCFWKNFLISEATVWTWNPEEEKQEKRTVHLSLSFFLIFIYVFVWLCWVLVVACRIFVAACGIFSCSIQTLSCSMWDLVPWPGIEPRPPALWAWSLSHWTIREVPSTVLRVLVF